MKLVLFGATGMVGQGVLLECLDADDVTEVVSVVRRPGGRTHPKLHEVLCADFTDLRPHAEAFRGARACFYCLGVSSAGMAEPDYRRVCHDFPLAAARVLAEVAPGAAFVLVTGVGADAQSRTMWARVRGEAEQTLLTMPGLRGYPFRPGYIQPMRGVTSRTGWYRGLYAVGAWSYPALRRLAPGMVTTSVAIGRAMLALARDGGPPHVVDVAEMNRLGGGR